MTQIVLAKKNLFGKKLSSRKYLFLLGNNVLEIARICLQP